MSEFSTQLPSYRDEHQLEIEGVGQVLIAKSVIANKQTIFLIKMMYTWRLTVTPADAVESWTDAWCFDSVLVAGVAFWLWEAEEGTEPWGWIKHPLSGRRRDSTGREWNDRDETIRT